MTNKCYDHQQSEQGSRQCKTCKRIKQEARVVKKVIDTLLLAGYQLATDADAEGGGRVESLLTFSNKRKALYDRMMTVDDERLYVRRPETPNAFASVYFVYGNSGAEVIYDYSTSLECYIEPIMTWCQDWY